MTEHDDTSTEVATSEASTEPDAATSETAHEPDAAAGAPDLAAIRELVLRAHPDVVPELIAGESIDALLASVGPAQDAYQRLAQRFPQPSPPTPPSVPAGGDRPVPVDPERLPASEKIRRGLANRQH